MEAMTMGEALPKYHQGPPGKMAGLADYCPCLPEQAELDGDK